MSASRIVPSHSSIHSFSERGEERSTTPHVSSLHKLSRFVPALISLSLATFPLWGQVFSNEAVALYLIVIAVILQINCIPLLCFSLFYLTRSLPSDRFNRRRPPLTHATVIASFGADPKSVRNLLQKTLKSLSQRENCGDVLNVVIVCEHKLDEAFLDEYKAVFSSICALELPPPVKGNCSTRSACMKLGTKFLLRSSRWDIESTFLEGHEEPRIQVIGMEDPSALAKDILVAPHDYNVPPLSSSPIPVLTKREEFLRSSVPPLLSPTPSPLVSNREPVIQSSITLPPPSLIPLVTNRDPLSSIALPPASLIPPVTNCEPLLQSSTTPFLPPTTMTIVPPVTDREPLLHSSLTPTTTSIIPPVPDREPLTLSISPDDLELIPTPDVDVQRPAPPPSFVTFADAGTVFRSDFFAALECCVSEEEDFHSADRPVEDGLDDCCSTSHTIWQPVVLYDVWERTFFTRLTAWLRTWVEFGLFVPMGTDLSPIFTAPLNLMKKFSTWEPSYASDPSSHVWSALRASHNWRLRTRVLPSHVVAPFGVYSVPEGHQQGDHDGYGFFGRRAHDLYALWTYSCRMACKAPEEVPFLFAMCPSVFSVGAFLPWLSAMLQTILVECYTAQLGIALIYFFWLPNDLHIDIGVSALRFSFQRAFFFLTIPSVITIAILTLFFLYFEHKSTIWKRRRRGFFWGLLFAAENILNPVALLLFVSIPRLIMHTLLLIGVQPFTTRPTLQQHWS